MKLSCAPTALPTFKSQHSTCVTAPVPPLPLPPVTSHHLQGRVSRLRCVCVRAAQIPPPVQWNIHGRHVTVDDTLEQLVKQKLAPALNLLRGAEFLEGEGGVHDVDVRLM